MNFAEHMVGRPQKIGSIIFVLKAKRGEKGGGEGFKTKPGEGNMLKWERSQQQQGERLKTLFRQSGGLGIILDRILSFREEPKNAGHKKGSSGAERPGKEGRKPNCSGPETKNSSKQGYKEDMGVKKDKITTTMNFS